MRKEDVSCNAYIAFAMQLCLKAGEQDAKTLGEAPDKFSAFPDTVEAVKLLGTHYKLTGILDCFEKQITSLVADALLTAETIRVLQIGSKEF